MEGGARQSLTILGREATSTDDRSPSLCQSRLGWGSEGAGAGEAVLSRWSSQIHGCQWGVLLGWFSGSRGGGTEPWEVAEASGEAELATQAAPGLSSDAVSPQNGRVV